MSKKAKYLDKIDAFLAKNKIAEQSEVLLHLLQEYAGEWGIRTHRDLAKNLIAKLESTSPDLAAIFTDIGAEHAKSPIKNDADFAGVLQAFLERYPDFKLGKSHPKLFIDLELPADKFTKYLYQERQKVMPFLDQKSEFAHALSDNFSDAKQQNTTQGQTELRWRDDLQTMHQFSSSTHDDGREHFYPYSLAERDIDRGKPRLALQDDFTSLQAHLKLDIEGIIRMCCKLSNASVTGFPTSLDEYNHLLKNIGDMISKVYRETTIPEWQDSSCFIAVNTILSRLDRIGEFDPKKIDSKAIDNDYLDNLPPNFICYWLSRLIEKNLLNDAQQKQLAINIARKIFNLKDNQPLALAMSYHILERLGIKPNHADLENRLMELHNERVKAIQTSKKQPAPGSVRFLELELLIDMYNKEPLIKFAATTATAAAAAIVPSAPPQAQVFGTGLDVKQQQVATAATMAASASTQLYGGVINAAAHVAPSAPPAGSAPDVKIVAAASSTLIEALILEIKNETGIDVDRDPKFQKFCCPISLVIMRDPATITVPGDENFEGDTFEHSRIRTHFETRKTAGLPLTNPLTNDELPHTTQLVHNRHLRTQISDELTQFRNEKRAEREKGKSVESGPVSGSIVPATAKPITVEAPSAGVAAVTVKKSTAKPKLVLG